MIISSVRRAIVDILIFYSISLRQNHNNKLKFLHLHINKFLFYNFQMKTTRFSMNFCLYKIPYYLLYSLGFTKFHISRCAMEKKMKTQPTDFNKIYWIKNRVSFLFLLKRRQRRKRNKLETKSIAGKFHERVEKNKLKGFLKNQWRFMNFWRQTKFFENLKIKSCENSLMTYVGCGKLRIFKCLTAQAQKAFWFFQFSCLEWNLRDFCQHHELNFVVFLSRARNGFFMTFTKILYGDLAAPNVL